MSAVTIGQQLERINSKGRRATLGDIGRIAETLDCPLWVMMIPGLSDHPDLLQEEGLQRLMQMVQHYIDCSDCKRCEVETVAHAGWILATVGRLRRQ